VSLTPCFAFLRSAIKDFQTGSDFLLIVQTSADMITFSASAPDPKMLKKKALLAMKAREENDDDYGDNGFFPTGIENEVVFQEITGKCLSNLHAQCQVSHPSPFQYLAQLLALGKEPLRSVRLTLNRTSSEYLNFITEVSDVVLINCHFPNLSIILGK